METTEVRRLHLELLQLATEIEEIEAAAREQAEAQREAEREGAWAATRREARDAEEAARTAALREACATADAARAAAEVAAASGAVALRAAEEERDAALRAAESRAREAVVMAQAGYTPYHAPELHPLHSTHGLTNLQNPSALETPLDFLGFHFLGFSGRGAL